VIDEPSQPEQDRTEPHVILIHRYFWPDSPPYALMLRSIAETLGENGFRVSVVTAQPSYGASSAHRRVPVRQTEGGVAIRRLPLLPERKTQLARRMVNLVAFAVQASVQVLRADNPQVVMAATTPPVLVAWMTSLAARARGAAFVYHNQDIYPEVLGPAPGGMKRLLQSLVRRLDTATGKRAAKVVVLSRDMAATWQGRGLSHSGTVTINNFFDVNDEAGVDNAPVLAVSPRAHGKRRLVFAGNVGHFQDLAGLVRAVRDVDDDRLELIVVGDGAALEECQRAASDHTRFIGRCAPAVAQAWIESADACVVSLHAGVIPFVYPSKTFAYLAAGVPLFVRVEPDSELGERVIENELGWVVSPADAMGLNRSLRAFASAEEATLVGMRERATAVSLAHNREATLGDWTDLFRSLIQR